MIGEHLTWIIILDEILLLSLSSLLLLLWIPNTYLTTHTHTYIHTNSFISPAVSKNYLLLLMIHLSIYQSIYIDFIRHPSPLQYIIQCKSFIIIGKDFLWIVTLYNESLLNVFIIVQYYYIYHLIIAPIVSSLFIIHIYIVSPSVFYSTLL